MGSRTTLAAGATYQRERPQKSNAGFAAVQ
jgi:hypothetical protein